MNWHKVTLSLRGPTGTPWQADTIFGHLCWLVRHREGEKALSDFLEWYENGMPLLLLSDGFPGDLLPRPLTLTAPRAESREAFRAARDARKLELITPDDFHRAIAGESFVPQDPTKNKRWPPSRVTLKNQISRLTGTTGQEGNLFGFREYWIPQVTIYLKVQERYEARAGQLFDWLSQSGYGKRKSVGYGAIANHEFKEFAGFPVPQGANGFVSLSRFVPSPTDPTEGRWRIEVKYGKLGEDFAAAENPFKRPLVMLAPGTVLRHSPVREFYGRMVNGLSQEHPEVVHYGYALPVPMHIPSQLGE